MKLLLAVTGTRGDVQPVFALAHAATGAGHNVTVAAPPTFASWAEQEGIRFVSCGIDIEAFVREHAAKNALHGRRAAIAGLRAFFEADIPSSLAVLEPLVQAADAVVGCSLQIVGKELCEAYRKPYCHMSYTAQQLPSAHHPPMLLPIAGLPGVLNRLTWLVASRVRGGMVHAPINAVRKRLGLREHRRYPYLPSSVALNLIATDPALDPIPRDVRAPFRQTGFLYLDQAEPLPDAIEAFLSSGPAPIYLGFGSMVQQDPAATTRTLVDAIERTGSRAVLSAGWSKLTAADLPPSVLLVQSVAHRRLFPRVTGVVHHGGAGTTAAAALAGVPQVIVPHLFDQARWGGIIHTLGLGPRPLPAGKLDASRLANRLQGLARYAPAAQGIQRRLSLDGARGAVDAIVQHALT